MKIKFFNMKSVWLFLFAMISLSVAAQERSISGTVSDASTKEPLIGVTVLVEGTFTGTVTDFDGNYTIKVESGKNLVFSFVGYQAQTIAVGQQSKIDVSLALETRGLDEVVVIGYGQVKKSDATGSVVAIDSKSFNKGAITSAQDLLVGKSAGVVITTSGGAPGSGSTIRVRGGSSLNASNDPLIIIDGVALDNNNIAGSSNFLSFVNPNDIETFTVLKDASATAIYGSRASNGVILITTKKGKAGSPFRVSYNGNFGVASPIKYLDVYSGDEMRQIALDKVNSGLFDASTLSKLGSENTNWQKEIFRTAITHDHNVSFSGSADVLPYRVSLGYTSQDGIMKNTDMRRYTGSISLDPVALNGNLKINLNAKGMYSDHNYGDTGAQGSALNMDPTQPIKDGTANSDGYFQWPNYGANLGTPNPVEQLMAADNKSTVKRLIANAQFNYRLPFLPELQANLNVAKDHAVSEGHNIRPTTSPSTLTAPLWGRVSNYSGENFNDLFDFYLNYNKEFESIRSRVDATAGYSWQHFLRKGKTLTHGVEDLNHPYQETENSSFITENYLVSFFGRLNYTFANRYLFTLTVRNDGSSRFSGDNQWGLFPSAAFAWKIKEESFLKDVDAVSDLKLRLGWGLTGQQDIGNDYPAQATYIASAAGSYYPIDGMFRPTLRPNAYDPDIKWEETDTKNIGLDFGFADNRITGSIDLYKRVTNDLLNTVTIPTGSNFSNTLLTNVGSLENKGVEFTLDVMPISKQDMSLNIGFNLTYNENTITKLLLTDDPDYIGILYGDAFTGQKQVTRVGYPAYSFFVNKQVYGQDGKPIEGLYEDLSGEGGAVNGDNNDKYIYKDPAPDFLLGLSARFNYKNFDFSASARASIGNYVYNGVSAGASYDQVYQIGYWKNFTKYLTEHNFVKRQFTSDYFVENGSFMKLDNISAGYTFNNLFEKISARVSFTAQNIWTVTKYKGLDPEVSGGIDNNIYPRPQVFILGLNVNY